MDRSWVELSTIQGCVTAISWRCVILRDDTGKIIHVPNHLFLLQSWSVVPSGTYRKQLYFWIAKDRSLSKLEIKITGWLTTAPWVGEFHGLFRDPSHPQLIVIDVSLLHFEDTARLQKALRILIEEDSHLIEIQESSTR